MCMDQSRSTGCKHGGAFVVFECFRGSESARLAEPRVQTCGAGMISAPESCIRPPRSCIRVHPRASSSKLRQLWSTHCAHQTAQTCGTNRTFQPSEGLTAFVISVFCNASGQGWGEGKHLPLLSSSFECVCVRESEKSQRFECVHTPAAPAAEGGVRCLCNVGVWVGEQRASCRRDCRLKYTRNQGSC